MIKKTKFYLFILSSISLLFLLACQNQEPKEEAKTTAEVIDSSAIRKKAERIKTIFYSLPSPLELSILFKREGVEYHFDELHDLANKDHYVTSVKKGLNLGVYGADLSYAGLFAKHDDAIQYFSACQYLAEDLGIGQTFQKEFITRLERNANNKDTLLQVISDFFLENDTYLKDNHQKNLSTYVLVGGWIEGLYLGTKMVSEKSDAEGIREIIIGQLNSLDQLNELLNDSTNSTELELVKESMIELRGIYDEIEFGKKAEKEPSSNTEEVLIMDNGMGDGLMSDSTFKSIKEKVTAIRAFIIR